MLQEIMQNNSINVVEEPVVERNNHQTELEVPRTPRTPTSKDPFPACILNNGHLLITDSAYLIYNMLEITFG